MIIMRCHEGRAKSESKLSSPLERERGSCSQEEPGCSQAGAVTVSQPVPGGLGAQPGSCSSLAPAEPPTKCPGQEQRWEHSLGGTEGVGHVLVALSGCSGLAEALHGPSAPREGWFGVPCITRGLESFGVIGDPLWCEG